MMEKNQKVLAYCNLFGVLGAVPRLLELDEAARKTVEGCKLSIGFTVKGGPCGTLFLDNGKAEMREGKEKCGIRLYFPSCESFNRLIDGKGMPIPVSGFHHIGFLLKNFTALTDRLSVLLRPTEEALREPAFFEASTKLMLQVIAASVAQIANHDQVGRFSASNIADGVIRISIGEDTAVALQAQEHRLTVLPQVPQNVFSQMHFDSLETARALFDGKINSVAAVGLGKVRIGGMISQIDNVNRILDRVSFYLA